VCPLAITTYDFSHTAELTLRAETAANLWLGNEFQALLGEEPHRLLAPHRHARA